MAKSRKPPQKRGPKTERLKIDENWENSIKKAIQKEKPKDGWPKKAKKGRNSD